MQSHYRGIETNNLKNIDITIPHKRIILITGVSGSGKSSLAIDTIHSVSINELNQLMNIKNFVSNYKIKQYDNILPSISLEQENYNNNPRSTIATYFGLDVFFKNLFSLKNNVSQSFFQFNRFRYACKECLGTGIEKKLDPVKVIDYNKIIKDIPFKNWQTSYSDYFKQLIKLFCKDNKIDLNKYISDLDSKQRDLLLYGKGNKKYKINFKAGGRKRVKTSVYIGPLNEESIFSSSMKNKFYTEKPCPICDGYRFSKNILKYELYGKNIGEIYTLEIDLLYEWIVSNQKNWKKRKDEAEIFEKILHLLKNFIQLRLGYLNLNRSIPSLSGGELQRLRLSKAISSQFNNFLYILDEPTSGLHPSEIQNIAKSINGLKVKGNSVIIIDHNTKLKDISDNIFILGPMGGKNGGKIVEEYPSIHKMNIPEYHFFKSGVFKNIKNESFNNVKNLSVKIPLQTYVSICGVSGSGKTSFLKGILPKYFKRFIYLNQSPIKGNNYSIIASYLKIFEEIRNVFSSETRLSASSFSFHHSSEGKCSNCNGTGFLKDEKSYNFSNKIVCPKCEGKRYSDSVLNHKFKGFNIYEFLNLTINELIHIIKNDKRFGKTTNILNTLIKMGLGYLSLFRSISTLSGGESQRIKLCKALTTQNKKVYLLDEPLRGVDKNNAYNIIKLVYEIVKAGNTVFIADHNLIAINHSSYIMEFGPGAGKYGGDLLYIGEKNNIFNSKKSLISDFLVKDY